jgi:hypothetical protein
MISAILWDSVKECIPIKTPQNPLEKLGEMLLTHIAESRTETWILFNSMQRGSGHKI